MSKRAGEHSVGRPSLDATSVRKIHDAAKEAGHVRFFGGHHLADFSTSYVATFCRRVNGIFAPHQVQAQCRRPRNASSSEVKSETVMVTANARKNFR